MAIFGKRRINVFCEGFSVFRLDIAEINGDIKVVVTGLRLDPDDHSMTGYLLRHMLFASFEGE